MLWETILPFAGYAFNKSHAAGYGLVSYWTAYLKANYPAEYMAALLTSVGDDKDKTAIYLSDCRRLGIRVLQPDVNESTFNFAPVGKDIRFGLGAIRNVGEQPVDDIVASRDEKATTPISLITSTRSGKVPALRKSPNHSLKQGLSTHGTSPQGTFPGACGCRRCRFRH